MTSVNLVDLCNLRRRRRTSLLRNEELLEEAARPSGEKTYCAAARRALEEFVRRVKARDGLDNLPKASGSGRARAVPGAHFHHRHMRGRVDPGEVPRSSLTVAIPCLRACAPCARTRSEGASCGRSGPKRLPGARSGAAAAPLELLPAPAGTGVVPADLGFLTFQGSDRESRCRLRPPGRVCLGRDLSRLS